MKNTIYDIKTGEIVETDVDVPTHTPTEDEILAMKKAQRQIAVDAIKVTTTSGKEFDGDEISQGRMARAILTAQISGITETTWVLANNVPTLITLTELQEALALSMQAQAEVWATPYL